MQDSVIATVCCIVQLLPPLGKVESRPDVGDTLKNRQVPITVIYWLIAPVTITFNKTKSTTISEDNY